MGMESESCQSHTMFVSLLQCSRFSGLNCHADDFFVGIGDINSAFLPKLEPMTPVLAEEAPKPVQPAGSSKSDEEAPSSQLTDDSSSSLALPESSSDGLLFEDDELSEITKDDLLNRNTMALDQQVEERPLAKKQEELQVEALSSADSGSSSAAKGEEVTPAPKPTARKALLKNDDIELTRVQNVRNMRFLIFWYLRAYPMYF